MDRQKLKHERLKRAILQHLLKHQGEFTHGRILDTVFGCSDRQRKAAIQSLRFEGYPIIVPEDKQEGYKFSNDVKERKEYYDRSEKELKTRLASIKTMRALCESGELFAQEFVIAKEMESM